MCSETNWNNVLKAVFLGGLEAVKGKSAVSRALDDHPDFAPTVIASIGKAASDMYEGCRSRFPTIPAFIATKYDHRSVHGSNVRSIEAAHPVPDEESLRAGEALANWLQSTCENDRLLLLISGGASSLVERLVPGVSLEDLQSMTSDALRDGSTIEQLNARRIQISRLKGGKFLSGFRGERVLVLAISDVASDGIDLIGSGIGDRGSYQGCYQAQVVASNRVLREELAKRCEALGLNVAANRESLNLPVEKVVVESLLTVETLGSGTYIFGGEPTVALPNKPGIGGRAQGLALLFAKAIKGRSDLHVLVSGTDGSDGVSDATGAIVDGRTFARLADAEDYLQRADSGTYFNRTGEAIVTGPTGTNVADVVILLKH